MSENLSQTIDNLDVSEKWKTKFKQIHAAKPISLGIAPKFENPKELKFRDKFNFLAVFNIIYYAIKGMWKKAIVLFVANCILMAIISLVNPAYAQLPGYAIIGLCMGMANNDFYRLKVLKEDFWW